MKKSITLIFLTVSIIAFGQDFVTELNGFRLGQFRDVARNEFGKAIQENKFDDGFEYEMYLLEKDSSAYIIFEYPTPHLETIWSIQVTNHNSGSEFGLKGLKAGMTSGEVISVVGKPTSKNDVGAYGETWIYDNANYTLEINPQGKLAGVKILDASHKFFREPDFSRIPGFDAYSKILSSGNKSEIADLLAPGMEIYKDNATYSFKYAIGNEIQYDKSGMFKLIEEMAAIMDSVDINDSEQYQENLRMSEYQGTLPVVKFSRNNVSSEIVFKYLYGKFLIWEIKIN